MNKVSLAEAGDGSPPFWSIGQTGGFHKTVVKQARLDSRLVEAGSHGLIQDHLHAIIGEIQ